VSPSRADTLARAGVAALSGVALFLSAPPYKLWPLCFCAAAGLAWAVRELPWRRAFGVGLLAASMYWVFAAQWLVGTVVRFTGLPRAVAFVLFALFCFGQSLMVGVQCAASALARPTLGAGLAAALAALAAERYVSAVFAWQFAAPLVDAPWLPQAADVVTVSGISALVHGTATAAVQWASERSKGTPSRSTRIGLYGALALSVLGVGYGAVRSARFASSASRPIVRVALVQPAVPPLTRWDERAAEGILQTLHAETGRAIAMRPDLIVWHEGAYPYVLPHEPGVDGLRGPPVYPVREVPPIVFGLMSAGEGPTRYNGVFVRNEDGTLSAPVAKRALVPFGEAVPLASTLPWLARAFALSGGISPGAGSPLLRTRAGLTFGVLVCLEDTLAHVAADAADGALLVNLTNDAWFIDPIALEEHLLMARWRSIELRRETVRAVNTGVSGQIDARGRMVVRGPTNQATVLLVHARTWDVTTFAPRFARWAGPSAALTLILAALWTARARRRASRAPQAGVEA
jgi:apolipoprotein N-acyltransferase